MPPIGNKLKQEENRKLLANPKVQAMLNTIAYAEGADYNTRVGGGTFDDLSKKPGKSTYIKSIGTNSTAEGRYQFLNSTWDAVAKDLNLPDFSPESQDLAAIELIKRRGALNDVLAGNLTEAIPKLSKEWASLPTKSGKSAYGQRARSFESLRNVYEGGAGGSSYVGTGGGYASQSYTPPQYVGQFTNYGEGNYANASASLGEEDKETPEEKQAKETIDKVTTEKEMIQDYYAQNQVAQQDQQFQQPQEQTGASPSLLDQYAQVSQFVDNPIAQEGGYQMGTYFDEDARELPSNMMNSQPTQDYQDYLDSMRGMMKSKIGIGNALNHPAIKRMSQATPKEGMTPEGKGTHYMSSHDNQAIPLLQDRGGDSLQYMETPPPSSEDINFDRPEDAAYFGEHYKEVAPMSTIYKGLQEYEEGGFIKDNLGQWMHPGKKTEIASPHITMKGVNYPVLGISKETGEQKMMMPNTDYFFEDTQNVLEIPQLKNYFNKK